MAFTETILITGGTSGLGYQCALALARQHPKCLIVIASRTDSSSAAKTINATLSNSNVLYLPLDLSSLSNIRTFAATWTAQSHPPIRALLLNAGLQFPNGIRNTVDGFEATFGVNHIGHALLFNLLYPHLVDNARIIITSSGTHDPAQKTGLPDAIYDSAEKLAHPSGAAEAYQGRQRYASSKLANVLWTYALAAHFARSPADRGKSVVAFDPGLMPGTGLARDSGPVLRFVWNSILPRIIPLLRLTISHNIHTMQESGEALAWVAMSEDLLGRSGIYFEGRRDIRSSEVSYDVKKQQDLWDWTERTLGISG